MTIFSPQQLQDLVSQTIPPTLPEGHQNAIVGTVDDTGAQVEARFTRDTTNAGTWQFVAAYEHTWAGDDRVGAQMIVSW